MVASKIAGDRHMCLYVGIRLTENCSCERLSLCLVLRMAWPGSLFCIGHLNLVRLGFIMAWPSCSALRGVVGAFTFVGVVTAVLGCQIAVCLRVWPWVFLLLLLAFFFMSSLVHVSRPAWCPVEFFAVQGNFLHGLWVAVEAMWIEQNTHEFSGCQPELPGLH